MWWTVLRAGISKYKWIILFGLFLAYSAGLWHVCSEYQKSSYLTEKLKLEAQNQDLSKKLVRELDRQKEEAAVKNKQENEEIRNEVQKHPEFADCRIPDSVQQRLKDKLAPR